MFYKTIAVAAAGAVLLSASPALADDAGFYGSGDPTYDGVYRQSQAILALTAVGRTIPKDSVRWLVGQQCGDGGFMEYRASKNTPCQAPDPINLTGQELNGTSMAVAALVQTGKKAKARKAAAWIADKRDSDGGYAYFPGDGATSDTASTALALAALDLVGKAPKASFLRKVQFRCTAAKSQRGAMSFDTALPEVNDGATAQAAWLLGGGLTVPAPRKIKKSAPSLDCKGKGKDSTSTHKAALGYLSKRLVDVKGALPYGGGYPGTDYAGTASATLALANAGVGRPGVKAGVKFLKKDAESWITGSGTDSPGALSMLILVAKASGENPKDFGGINLLSRLAKTRQ